MGSMFCPGYIAVDCLNTNCSGIWIAGFEGSDDV